MEDDHDELRDQILELQDKVPIPEDLRIKLKIGRTESEMLLVPKDSRGNEAVTVSVQAGRGDTVEFCAAGDSSTPERH